MAKVSNKKLLLVEDFPEKYRSLVDRLAFSLNPFMDEVVNAFAGNIDISNLNQEIVQFNVLVDSNGVPQVATAFGVSSRPRGFSIINVTNNTDNSLLTGAPFITYSINNVLINVKHITGLLENKRYTVTLLVVK